MGVTSNVTPDMRRGLVLCSKMLTLIVNDTEFGIKEKHMSAFNDLLKPFRRTIAQFIRYCANAHKAELFPDEVPLTSLPFRDIDSSNNEPTVVDLSNWKTPLIAKKPSTSSEQIEATHDRKLSTTSKGSNELSHSMDNNGKKQSVTSFEGLKKVSSNELPEIVERESSNDAANSNDSNPFTAPPPPSGSANNMEIELQGPRRRQAIRKQSDTAKVSLQGLMFEIKARALLAEGDELDVLEKVVAPPTPPSPETPPIAMEPVKPESPVTKPSPPSTLTKKLTQKLTKEASTIKEENSLTGGGKDSEVVTGRGRSTTLAKIKGMMPLSFSPRGSISDRNPFKSKAKQMAEADMDSDILAFFDILCKSFSTLKKDIEVQTAQMQEPEKTECEKRGKRFLTLLMSGYKDKS